MSFRFFRPQSRDEALALLAEHGDAARPIAGGTDLSLRLRRDASFHAHLVCLAGAGLSGVTESDDGITVGATTPLRTLWEHSALRERLPHLVSACRQIGARQIQEVGTLGGNLGNASPAADSAPPLLVEDARVRLASARGEREVALTDFFVGPGRTRRAADELIVAIFVPEPTPALVARQRLVRFFRKYGPRRANVISAVTFAARLALDGDRLLGARLALGCVGPTPRRMPQTEAWLDGRVLCRELLGDPALEETVRGEIAPISDVRGSADYKALLAVNSVRYALWRARKDADE